MASGRDRAFYSGKHKAHGLNVQVIGDPIGRLVWISPPLPGARHDRARPASTASSTRSPSMTSLPRPTPPTKVRGRPWSFRDGDGDPDTGRFRKLSQNQKDVNTAHARRRGPGERVNAELKNWRVLRKIRSSPSTAATLIAAVQTLMIANS
jgi:hypothetical protein